ncbi:3'-5' exonuclease [Rhizobium sp. BK176]|uniref:3'-5' exonuclease n=1 Tax=Rhizobium sp. BK176 TaxID=2587071 RepID=UPI002167FB56|nr:3'-5' exonuclease [Rhizobium sp. BK176]MCS4089857.1 inhibitor of KinA sporulation pathway (predicted exonuclease) [Rhizobium sp. BK176]
MNSNVLEEHNPMTAKYKVRLDRVLSVDFEMTCWEGEPPPGQFPEIIQIGITEIDNESMTRLRSESWYVRNQYSEVSPYCTALTGITPAILRRRGITLAEAGRIIAKKYGSKNKGWLAWGSDKAAIDRDCASKNVEAFFSNAFFNVGLLYSMVASDGRSIGLDEAAERFGISFEGRPHDAGADADVLAEVWCALGGLIRLPSIGPEPSNLPVP